MIISQEIYHRTFSGKNTKEAYFNATKWLASNVIAVNNSEHISYTFSKVGKEINKDVKLTIYVMVNEPECFDRVCKVCKEATKSFFMHDNRYLCENCRAKVYRERLDKELNGWKGIIREKLGF